MCFHKKKDIVFPLIVAFRSREGIDEDCKDYPRHTVPRFCIKQKEDNMHTAYTYTDIHAAHLYICSRTIQLRLLLIINIIII